MYCPFPSDTQPSIRRTSEVTIARTTLPAGIPASLNWYVAAADDIAPLYSRWFVRGHAENFSPLSPEPQTRYSFDVSSYEFAGTDTVIAPSLRISYMILPPALLRRLRERRDPYSCNVPTLEQYTLREFMRQGYFEKHLNRMRVCYRNRRRELCELLRPYEDRLRVIGARAGSYLLTRVENGMDEQRLCDAALRLGVRVWPISSYFMDAVPEPYRACVLLGYGNLTSAQMRRGVTLLAKAWGLDDF